MIAACGGLHDIDFFSDALCHPNGLAVTRLIYESWHGDRSMPGGLSVQIWSPLGSSMS